MTSLSLGPDETGGGSESGSGRGRGLAALVVALVLLCAGLGYLGYRQHQQTRALEAQLAALNATLDETRALAAQAQDRAGAAESAAKAAEAQTLDATREADAAKLDADSAMLVADAARLDADTARQDASAAKEKAAKAQAEADRIRQRALAEVKRLEEALGQIAETRRTALGLVMNLGSDYLKFEFDKAELRPEDKELLSRIAGILMTSRDYTLSVNGHTDDVGSAEYNQKLSLRRAQAVRDYLEQAGLSPDILSVEGHGKSLPLVKGTSDAARAKNRRVELGLVNMQIQYPR